MLVVSDTHRESGHGLPPGAMGTLEGADGAPADPPGIVHAGDLTTVEVLEAFQGLGAPLHAVHGNADSAAVQSRLPAARTVALPGGRTLAVTHTRRGGAQALSLFGRGRGADVVVSGHTHDPGLVETPDCVLLDPGSHTGTRAAAATYATIEAIEPTGPSADAEAPDTADPGLALAIRAPDGTVRERTTV